MTARCFRCLLMLPLSWLAATLPLAAQETEEVLTRVKEVLALPEAEAREGTRTVRLRGVVTDVSAGRDEFTLHDGEESLSVKVGGFGALLADEVEVDGRAILEPHIDRQRIRVMSGKVTVLGGGVLPEPKPVTLEAAAKFSDLDQWVSVEGMVLQVRSSMSLFTIQLATGSAICNVLVRDWPREAIPRDWIGGRVRVAGVNRAYLPGNSFLSVVVPSPAQVTVLKTGVSDPLDAPVTTIPALIQAGTVKEERVKLTGTLLTATAGNVYYVRGAEGGAFSFYMLNAIDEDKSGRYSTPIIMPKAKPGDVLEVVGVPRSVQPGVHLNYGVARVLSSGTVPAAVSTDLAAVNAGKHVHDLVEVEGRLLSVDDVLVAPGRYRTTMKLEDAAGQKIVASMDAPVRGALAHLVLDHRLRLRAVVTGAPHFPEIRLWLARPEDLQSLGMATEVVTRRMWTGIGIAALVMLMLAAWALMLRRSHTLVRELNAGLETRVAERTSELAAAKDDLAQALSQERELGELKSRFVTLVSHEFRTPLGITMSAVEVLRHYRDRIKEEKQVELLDDIHYATLRMSAMMEQVLLLGKAEAGKITWHPAALDLAEFCDKLMDEGLSATNRRCPVRLSVEGDFSEVRMDEALLRHSLGNLLSNAIKYSPPGSEVDFKVRREGDEAVFTVEDRGIGIPAADQARLFEAFHRASNVGETPGTGLGLLLVKRCVELHHGRIELHSQEGIGTTFTVRLPVGREA